MKKRAYFLPVIMFLASIVFVIVTALLTLTYSNYKLARKHNSSTTAMSIAEAGINYYLWHLSHNNQDYCDGQTGCSGSGPFGPYYHDYKDTDGRLAGRFTLEITPPASGSNTVTVKSTGQKDPTGEKRTVIASIGIPSFSRYSFITNSQAWFGETESTKGLVHSNSGIRFDGQADGIVSSGVPRYQPTTCSGGNGSTYRDGVWDNITRQPTDQTRSFWTFPVPTINFNSITSDFNTIKNQAINGGLFLPTLLDNRGRKTHDGYLLELLGNTVRVSKVSARTDSGSSNNKCSRHSAHRSLINSTVDAVIYTLPSNGVIFVEDNVWIWGSLSSRLTVASARLPENQSTYTNIYLQNDITYSAYDGTAALGLIAQNDIVVNSNSENDLRLDAYMLSQKGQVFRPLYAGNVKNSIYVYGGIGTYSWWTWSWVSGSVVVSGYQTTTQEYDNNLVLTPPPSFPTTGSYSVLSWRESVE